MARTRHASRRAGILPIDSYLSGLSSLGSTLSYDALQEDDKQGIFQGLGALGDASTLPSITGITAVDQFLYGVEDELSTFKLAMTITTIASLAGAIAGVLLLLDRNN